MNLCKQADEQLLIWWTVT